MHAPVAIALVASVPVLLHHQTKSPIMPTIQLHYDGWLTLPADAREHLKVANGDRLEVEFNEGTLLLRPAKQTKAAPAPKAVAVEVPAAPAEPAPAEAQAAAAKPGRGRPRKLMVPSNLSGIKVGGRRATSSAMK